MSERDEDDPGAERETFARRVETLASEEYAYLTTTGRVTGQPHEIEIWFAAHNGRVYLLSGGGERSDWVKNLRQEPAVMLRLGETTLRGRARIVSTGSDDALARRLLAAKYEDWREDQPLSDWARTATPVMIEIAGNRRKSAVAEP
jgi:deazaflavin-dependent oxidoreductase (nitroreductase family)